MKPNPLFLAIYQTQKWQTCPWQKEIKTLTYEKIPLNNLEDIVLEDFYGGVVLASIHSLQDIQNLEEILKPKRSTISILALLSDNNLNLLPVLSPFDDIIFLHEKNTDILQLRLNKLVFLQEKNLELFWLNQQMQKNKKELQIAKYIQDMILTEIPPSTPSLDIQMQFKTTGLVGGDLCDFQLMSNDHVGFFLADVSGHGIGSALIASMTKILFKTFSKEINTPQWFLSNLNTVMIDILMPVEKFITAFYGIYHQKKLTYINAGHVSPLVYCPLNNSFTELFNTSCILGYARNIPMKIAEIPLKSGDFLFLFTDGLIEATNKKGEMFSVLRLQEFIQKNYQAPNLASLILKAVEDFSEKEESEDDMTLVVVKVK